MHTIRGVSSKRSDRADAFVLRRVGTGIFLAYRFVSRRLHRRRRHRHRLPHPINPTGDPFPHPIHPICFG